MPPPETSLYGPRAAQPPVVYAMGFSRWKRPALRAVFGAAKVIFLDDASRIPPNATCAAWGRKDIAGLLAAGVNVLRIEDGFLRSVGLGADLIAPVSLVVDRTGIYYDATAPSDLEELLESAEFTPALRQRAHALRARLVDSRLTKYNVGSSVWARPSGLTRVILVPGQVESDASLEF